MAQAVWYGNSSCASVLLNQTWATSLEANCSTCLNNGCYFCYDQYTTPNSYCYDGDIRNCQQGTPVNTCNYSISEATAIFLILLTIILICCLCGGTTVVVSCIKSNLDKTSRVVPTNAEHVNARAQSTRQAYVQEAYYVQQPHAVEAVAIPIVSAEPQPVIAHAIVIND